MGISFVSAKLSKNINEAFNQIILFLMNNN